MWIFIYLIELPNHFGWGDNRFSVVFYVCTFANHVHSYALFYIGLGVCVPVGGTFFAYLGIYLKVRDSNLVRSRVLTSSKLIKSRELRAKEKLTRRAFRHDVGVARALFRVYVIFLVMWLPVAVIIVMGKGTEVAPVWYILAILLAHGNSSINCVVYGASIEHFREGYLRILCLGTVRPCGSRSSTGKTSYNLLYLGSVTEKMSEDPMNNGNSISHT